MILLHAHSKPSSVNRWFLLYTIHLNTEHRSAFCYFQQACQHGGKQHGKDYDFSLGKITSAKWKIIRVDPLNFSVTYKNGDSSSPNGKPIKRYLNSRSIEFTVIAHGLSVHLILDLPFFILNIAMSTQQKHSQILIRILIL